MRLNRNMDSSHTETEAAAAAEPVGLTFRLSEVAARALGCLAEKELATPDAYPLTLNSLLNACNQRSNRDPIMALSSAEVEAGLDQLRLEKLAVWFSGADSRVPKFKHKLDQVFGLDQTCRAIFAELLLRGPQTAAQLRANAQRMCPMPEAEAFEDLLNAMTTHPAGVLVRKLPRQPGKKEARWAQLLTGEPAVTHEAEPFFTPALASSANLASTPTSAPSGVSTANAELERRVAELEIMMQLLQEQVALLQTQLPRIEQPTELS